MESVNERKEEEMFEGQVLVYKHINAYVDSMCLKWCVELGIPDIIHNHGQPITLHHLVSTLQIPPSKIDGVEHLMRYLVHNGLFKIVTLHHHEQNNNIEAYALTTASELLVRGNNPCLVPLVEYCLSPIQISTWNHSRKWSHVENLTLWEVSWGETFWDFLSKNSTFMDSFNEAMASDSQMINFALRYHKSIFEGIESIVDVGGGIGTTAKIISNMLPEIKCIVFDTPQVINNLTGSNNLSYVAGNMFESIPNTDAILLKATLHNWSDGESINILKKCKEAILNNGKKGKIMIIDTVLNEKQDEGDLTQLKLKLNIVMTTYFNGKERNEEEWKKLLLNAGLEEYKISQFTGNLSLIEIYI